MLLWLVVLVGAGVEESVGGHGGARKQQDVQEDILKAMKDSGVLNEWQEKLEEQLFPEENEVKTGAGGARKNVKKPVISPQEKEMLRSFVDEYKSDSSLTVDTDVILGIVERVQKTPKPNLPQIFVQLGPIIEVVSAITQKTKDVQKIVDRQSPVFDSPAKPKDVLHTLAENLKSELVRLTLDSPPKGGPARKKSKSPPKPAPAAPTLGGLDMADYLKLGANLMKGGNAAQMMKMMSGEMDMAGMIEMLPQLMEGGNVKDLLLKMAGSYLESSPYGALIQQYGKQAMDSPAGSAFLDNAWKVVEDFIKSDNGKRFMKLVCSSFPNNASVTMDMITVSQIFVPRFQVLWLPRTWMRHWQFSVKRQRYCITIQLLFIKTNHSNLSRSTGANSSPKSSILITRLLL